MPEKATPDEGAQATTVDVMSPQPLSNGEVLRLFARTLYSSLGNVKWTYKYHPTHNFHARRRGRAVSVQFHVPLKKGDPRFKRAFLSAVKAALELHHTSTAIAVNSEEEIVG